MCVGFCMPTARPASSPPWWSRPRRWAAFDFDDVARPAHVDVTDIAACGEVAVRLLPKPFHAAACVIQATSGHAIKPGIRLRLWHWFDRSVSGAELKYWLRDAPVDPAAFRPAQLIYVAAPLFAAGARDPLPSRLTWRPGLSSVRYRRPARFSHRHGPRRQPMRSPVAGSAGSGNYAATRLIRALVRIGRAPPGQRNPTLFPPPAGSHR